jgi:hypothetical protein
MNRIDCLIVQLMGLLSKTPDACEICAPCCPQRLVLTCESSCAKIDAQIVLCDSRLFVGRKFRVSQASVTMIGDTRPVLTPDHTAPVTFAWQLA